MIYLWYKEALSKSFGDQVVESRMGKVSYTQGRLIKVREEVAIFYFGHRILKQRGTMKKIAVPQLFNLVHFIALFYKCVQREG